MCRASGVGAEVDVDRLPASPALAARSSGDTLRGEQACGGDDYELCFTAPPDAAGAIAAAAKATGRRRRPRGRRYVDAATQRLRPLRLIDPRWPNRA